VGHCLWQEDGSVIYNFRWHSPAQSFLGPSPVGLVTIFYCLRFETSLFVTSYNSQVYGGGIQPRLHTGETLCHREITGKMYSKNYDKTCTDRWHFYAPNLGNKPSPWKSMCRINWRIFWNHFVPTASSICGVKTEYSGLKPCRNPWRICQIMLIFLISC
jgi:hypothetical protein